MVKNSKSSLANAPPVSHHRGRGVASHENPQAGFAKTPGTVCLEPTTSLSGRG